MQSLTVEIVSLDEFARELRLIGSLTADTRAQLDTAFDDLFALPLRKIVVNLKSLDYLASAGASGFLEALETAGEKNIQVVFVHPHPRVRYVFNTMGLPLDSDEAPGASPK